MKGNNIVKNESRSIGESPSANDESDGIGNQQRYRYNFDERRNTVRKHKICILEMIS